MSGARGWNLLAGVFSTLVSWKPAAAALLTLATQTGGGTNVLSGSLNFAQFDPTWGVLVSVTVQTSASLAANADILNTTGAARNISLHYFGTYSYSMLGISTPIPDPPPGTRNFDFTASGFFNNFQLANLDLGSTTFAQVSNVPDSAFLASYTGTGTFAVNFAFSASAVPDPIVSVALHPTSSFVTTVSYDYVPLPEPGSVGLLATGLLALVGYKRSRP